MNFQILELIFEIAAVVVAIFVSRTANKELRKGNTIEGILWLIVSLLVLISVRL
jgi:hypothetical protein